MNKAISTALLLAAGTALSQAASVYSNITSTEFDNLLAAWNFDSSASASTNSWTWSGTGGLGQSEYYGTFGSETTRPWKQDTTNGVGFSANAFTISFDLADLTGSGTLLSLYTNAQSGYQRSLQILVDGNGAITLQVGKVGGSSQGGWGFGAESGSSGSRENQVVSLGNISDYSSSSGAWKTLTVTSNGTNICVYLDGTLAEGGKLDYTTVTNSIVTGMQFGAMIGGRGTGISGKIDNMAIWNTALSAEQVKTLVALPEPSSFGLLAGLGALALVAARRRRSRKA